MEKLTAHKAYELLIEDVLLEENDIDKYENRWLLHCIYTGIASKRIAEKLGLDADYAMALGYVHDIGRKINHPNHTIEGYRYMLEKGYKEARICLTHSFIDNDIIATAGGVPEPKERYDFINSFLIKTPPTLYDNIVQMCDLFCLETGFTTIENRLLDITKRKGVYPNSFEHLNKVFQLKERLESQMGCDLYELFPEIKVEDKQRIDSDRKELMDMLKAPQKTL